MTKFINWGFIGLGNASLNLAKEFKKISNARLLSVASHTKEKRDFFKRKYHLKDQNIFSNYNDIFKNKDIEIIFIGLPNSFHEEYCLKALDNNKHVLVEKPLTNNIISLKKIKKKFLKKNLLLEEGTAYKFHPFYHKVLKIINRLNYTNILEIKSNFGNDALGGKKLFGFRFKKVNHNKRIFNKSLLGGSILDGGIYPVSLLIDIFSLFNKNLIKNLKITDCKKNISKDIDLSSTLNFKVDSIDVELKSTLIEKLDDDLTIYMNDQIIKLNGIFNISSNSYITYQNEDVIQKIKNINNENSYFYEIKTISDILLNHSSFKKIAKNSFNKIENNIKLLSRWYSY
tara:strand:- start:806 stop:1834 length:1029 start_codon:yes stop_codon:yes gene_type:complete